MTHILIWILIMILFILSFIGVIYPLLPSVLLIWGGFLLYYLFLSSDGFSIIFWSLMIFFTFLLFFSDIIANSYFVRRFGGSRMGENAAAIAVIIGTFIVPPFGILIVPFITVLIIEMLQRRTLTQAFQASLGSLLGFLGSALSKVVIQFVMIIWFFATIIF